MKCVLVICAIAALAMAQMYDMNLKHICSVSATGMANLNVSGKITPVPCQMKRVMDTGRWDLLGENNVPFATIISRNDLGRSYYWMATSNPPVCEELPFTLSLHYYDSDASPFAVDGTVVYELKYEGFVFATMTMNGGKLVSETFYIGEDVTVVLQYTEVNYEYVHTNEDDFSFSQQVCPEASEPATDVATEQWCRFTELPEKLCSFTANGTAAFSGLENLYVQVFRVKNTARYDFYTDEGMTQLKYSVFDRPDLGASFVYNPVDEEAVCRKSYTTEEYSTFSPFYRHYYDRTEDGNDIFTGFGKLYIDKETFDLVAEEKNIPYNEMIGVQIVITYDVKTLNYDWVYDNVDDQLFRPDNTDESCAEIYNAKPELALTATQCSAVSQKVPVVPGCAFEIDIKGKMQGFPITMNAKFHNITDGYAKVVVPGTNMFMGVRCDYRNGNGNCLSVSNMSLGGYCGNFFDYNMLESFGFTGFEYRLQPTPVDCPDGVSEGCMKYCLYSDYNDGEDDCHILDAEGRLAAVEGFGGLMSVEYKDSTPALSDFTLVLCDETALDAPTKDLCAVPGTSSSSSNKGGDSSSSNKGTSSSNKGTSSSSTTNGEESSSSISSPSFCLLSLLAVAVASLLFAF